MLRDTLDAILMPEAPVCAITAAAAVAPGPWWAGREKGKSKPMITRYRRAMI